MTCIFSGLIKDIHILVRNTQRSLSIAARFVSREKRKTPNEVSLTILLGITLI